MHQAIESGVDDLRLLTVREVGQLLGISPRTVWRLAAQAEVGLGDFPRPIRIGRLRRWRLADLRRFIESGGGGR